jgi:hypothetical protein
MLEVFHGRSSQDAQRYFQGRPVERRLQRFALAAMSGVFAGH